MYVPTNELERSLKRLPAALLALISLLSVLLATSAPLSAAGITERVFIEAPETTIRLDGSGGQIAVRGDTVTVGSDVRVTLRERGTTDIDVLRDGGGGNKLVLWYPAGETAHVIEQPGLLLVHLFTLDGAPTSTTGPDSTTTLPPVLESTTTSTSPMDHGSMDHGSTDPVAPKPVVVPDDPVTPYVTPFKKSASKRSEIGFSVTCDRSHEAKDDPIVFPGQPGRAHLHDFFGSTVTNAFTTAADLRAGSTTCSARDDKSAYWAPALYANGVLQEPTNTTFYYKPGVEDRSSIQPIPYGLEVVAGNAKATGPQNGQYFWFQEFGNASNNTGDGTMIRATKSGRITLKVVYPDCWDGQRLSAPDQSHVAYHTNKRTCPASHPVAMPQLTMFVTYGTNGDGVSLASGAWFTMHADFFNAWTPATQQRLIDECVKPWVRCGSVYDADSTRIPRRG